MKVLLLENVKGIGRRMDIKEVSEGYARNFLIPRKLAIPADQAALKIKKESEAKEQKTISEYENLAKKLSGETLEFSVKSGSVGEIFGSITKEQIKKALMERGLIYEKSEVELEKPLRILGEHQVVVNLGKGIKSGVKVVIKR